jgi:hypothetical protein
MRSRLILFTFLGAASLAVPAAAQSTQQRCAELEAQRTAMRSDEFNAGVAAVRAMTARQIALGRQRAIEGAAGTGIFEAVSEAEPYSAQAMRKFREDNRLPAELDDPIRAARPAEFWRNAEMEMKRILTDRYEALVKLRQQSARIDEEYDKLNCGSVPRETSGPLPINRRPDGQPIITDALITRWVKASYALKNSGGAYWQAGQMTQQDYVEVDRRINLYFNIMNSGRAAEQFSDDEMRAINIRLPDIRNVREGNWSQIKF